MVDDLINDIIKNYKLKIFKTCLGYTNNVDDANDLTQEIFIRIWKGLEKFRNESTLNTWIYRITINSCLMFKRKKKISFLSVNELDEHFIGKIDNLSFQSEDLDQLQKAIWNLKEKDRIIIILYLENLNYQEISDVLGFSTNYIGVKINRIKKVLYNKLNVI